VEAAKEGFRNQYDAVPVVQNNAPFIKERRMECINATSLRRKSGQWDTQL